MKIREAVIVDAIRTPLGKRNGKLKDWHPVDLLAAVLKGLADRNRLDPAIIDHVIGGCVSQVREQSINIARNAVLAAGFPESVPATTVDKQCGSSQQAIHFAANGIVAGEYEVAIACGVESMSRVPMMSNEQEPGLSASPAQHARYGNGLVHQGISSEMIARKWDLTRRQLDELSLESHRRAAKATEEGRFRNEILPLAIRNEDGSEGVMAQDEGIRRDTTIEKIGSLKPAFAADGVTTAGNASQISDGAAGVLLMECSAAERLGVRPRARIVALSMTANDPIYMLTAPASATQKVLQKAGLQLDQIDRIEINEAFASVVLAWQRETQADMARTNVNGGAIAMGHPLGASGARLMATLLNELERTHGRYGLQTMCIGGGQANGTIIERL